MRIEKNVNFFYHLAIKKNILTVVPVRILCFFLSNTEIGFYFGDYFFYKKVFLLYFFNFLKQNTRAFFLKLCTLQMMFFIYCK